MTFIKYACDKKLVKLSQDGRHQILEDSHGALAFKLSAAVFLSVIHKRHLSIGHLHRDSLQLGNGDKIS